MHKALYTMMALIATRTPMLSQATGAITFSAGQLGLAPSDLNGLLASSLSATSCRAATASPGGRYI